MSAIPGTVVGGAIVPSDTADTYPVTDPQWGLGGLRTVQSTTLRNAIPVQRLQKGMEVHVIDTGITYRLKDSWTGGLTIDADWEVAIGASGGITGSGIVDAVTLWNTPTDLYADANFTRSAITHINYNDGGYQTATDQITTRYIDPAGNDSNDGLTNSTPWRTPLHAMKQVLSMAPGSYRIICANGIYTSVNVFVPDFIGRDYGDGPIIEFYGDPSTPSNVTFSGSTSLVYCVSNATIKFTGIKFKGNGSNTGIIQFSGSIILSSCIADKFALFYTGNYFSRVTVEGSDFAITNTYRGFSLSYGAQIIRNGNIVITAPDGAQPTILFDLAATSFPFASGVTCTVNGYVSMLGAHGPGYLFRASGCFMDMGGFCSYNAINIDASFYADSQTVIRNGSNNYFRIDGLDNFFILDGMSELQDSGSTRWDVYSLTGGPIIRGGSKLTSSVIVRSGLLILEPLVSYVTIDPETSYTTYSHDARYVEHVNFNVMGKVPQGYSSADIGPEGASSVQQIVYISKGTRRITNLTVKSRLPTGVLIPDTYFIYVNGIISSLSAAMTNSNYVSADGSVDLQDGDIVTIRFTTSIFTQAEDLSFRLTIQKRN